MTLTLTFSTASSLPVEIEGLTPDWAIGKKLVEIERFEILHGNQKLPLAELFKVAGDPADGRFKFSGDLAGVHWIGAHMCVGEIHVDGPGGRHIGSRMRGGKIRVDGDAGDWVGAEMHGGLIHVGGNAGQLLGAAYPGSARGMTGGTILVEGDVGNEVGQAMRRGMIAVGGRVGDMLGANMLGGTILTFGECGKRPGAGMHRGTLGLLGREPTALLSSFRYACTARPTVLPVMAKHLHAHGFECDMELSSLDVDQFSGDLLASGRGEVFVRHAVSGDL